MRRYTLMLIISAVFAAPAFAASRHVEQQSPELKQCVQQCQTEHKKDATAREGCENRCVVTDAARRKQRTGTSAAPDKGSTSPGGQ